MAPAMCHSETAALLADLQQRGVAAVLLSDGRLQLSPMDDVPETLVAAVRRQQDTLRLLVAWQDDAVRARYEVFVQQYREEHATLLPLLTFIPNVDWQPGVCWSCGEALKHHRFGRCLACRAAWFLLLNRPMAVDPPTVGISRLEGAA